jgi:hypothetical protein
MGIIRAVGRLSAKARKKKARDRIERQSEGIHGNKWILQWLGRSSEHVGAKNLKTY